MRMGKSLAELERAFVEEAQVEQYRAVETVRETQLRARQREIEKAHKHGTMRFIALVAVLILTAVLVTFLMFETLYYVMG
jgi:hypothetical protein